LKTKVFRQVRLKCRVVSVGNLTTGGTGKTTLVLDLLRIAKKKNVKAAVVSRSYKAAQEMPSRVFVSDPLGAEKYGDEAFLIASEFPEFPVYVGRNKKEAALLCERNESPELVIVDDGFQHHGLFRDHDIVIVDTSAPDWHYVYLPFGRLREPMSAALHADTLIVSKARFAKSKWRPWAKIVNFSKNPLYMDYSAGELIDVHSGQRRLLNTVKGDKALLVSGIAGPEVFERMVLLDLSIELKSHMKFTDHHQYTDVDIEKIEKQFETLHCDLIITTAKDAVKLKRRIKAPIFYVELSRDIKSLEEQLGEVISG
jgi:tetraacyldisaccharide 4'-kinase